MSRKIPQLSVLILLFVGGALSLQRLSAQTYYSLPNVNSSCPASCRQITWVTGSDIWNSGSLPSYTNVTCNGLHANGTTDDTSGINACINALSSGQCAYLPAANYLVNGLITLKSNTCLRGATAQGGPPFLPTANSASTHIILGSGGQLTTQSFSDTSNVYPAISYGNLQSTCALSGSPAKGATSLTLGTVASGCNVSVGSYIVVFGNDNPSLINATGTDGLCNWCGENTGYYVMDQIVEVTAITSGSGGSGSVITISPALYYPPYTTAVGSEPAGAKYSVITFPTQKAGYESLQVDGSSNDVGANPLIFMEGCLFCWIKNVETYKSGSQSAGVHLEDDWSYGNEIRDSAFHDQRSGASGSGYGVHFMFVGSDHKVENNIFYHNRHAIVFEGGGSGVAILYNFITDTMSDDCTYLGSSRTSHGAHPFFDLFEGNIFSHLTVDDFIGSSSHDVLFRNWLWAGELNYTWPSGNIPTAGSTQVQNICSTYTFPPNSGFDAVDLYTGQTYYSYVNNVLGTGSAIGSTGVWGTWSAATLSITCAQNSCGYEAPGAPGVYSYGGSLGSTATSSGTILRQGNYDYKTLGVAYNDGGTGYSYQPSYYYTSKPSFMGSCPFPAQGSDVSPYGSLQQPAYQRAMGTSCSGTTTTPASPTNLTATPVTN